MRRRQNRKMVMMTKAKKKERMTDKATFREMEMMEEMEPAKKWEAMN